MALVGNISGSVQSNSEIGLSGTIIIANQPNSAFPDMPGTNVTFFVSGSANTDTDVSVFGGDLTVSGSFIGLGDLLEVSGTLAVTEGISGSLTTLADGTSYLIEGANITITSQSNGSIVISSTGGGGGGGNEFFESTVAGSIFTTGSAAFVDQEAVTSPSDKGTDVFFYVSGSIGSKEGATPGVSLFGGDVVISGSVYTEGNKFEMTGTLEVTDGISGSLTQLVDGTSYLVEGTNVTIVSQSNGSIVISSIPAGTGNEVQYNNGGSFGGSSNFEFDGSTVYLTGSLEVGSNSKANGLYSLAQGLDSNANAQYSIAMGRNVTATAQFAFAHGDTTLATGTASHAEGKQTKAYGAGSHVEGEQTEATAAYSHAEGYYTITSASHQHADGKFNLRDNNHSLLVIGNGTGDDNSLRSDIVRVEMDSVQISGSLLQRNSGSSLIGFMGDDSAMIPTEKGTDVFFYVSGSTNSKDGPEPGVALFGGDLVVSGSMFAIGNVLEISGTLLVTEGISGSLTQLTDGTSYLIAGTNISIISQSNGAVTISNTFQQADDFFDSTTAGSIFTTGSTAFKGQESIDSPTDKGTDVFFYVSGSTAAARSNASLFGGFVVISGSMTQGNFGASGGSTGQYSRAHGERTTASGASSHSEGRFALSQGPNSHAEGDSTATYGASSHAEGLDSAAFANYSHAEGRSTEARGLYSHTEGYDSISRADYSHAEGRDTETIVGADYSHAEGSGSITLGVASHAGGLCTIASGSNQTVFGQYNLRDNATSLFVIGNGTSDLNANRKDIVRVELASMQVTGSMSVSGSYSGNTDSLTGPGTIYSDGHSILLNCTGNSEAVTLSNGIWPGQLKYVVANSNYGGAGNTSIITPTNPLGYSSVSFGANGQAVTFFWTGSKWVIVGSYGATINP